MIAKKKKVELDVSEVLDKKTESTPVNDIKTLLERQVNHEFTNESLYLSMAVWCENNGYPQTAGFFNDQSLEERSHGIKFINHMSKRGIKVNYPHYEKVDTDFKDMKDILDKSLARENETMDMIRELHQLALKDSDPAIEIAAEFIEEQLEEEQLFRSLINLHKMCGDSKIDFEMEVLTVKANSKYKLGSL